jgi:hypothetical protein
MTSRYCIAIHGGFGKTATTLLQEDFFPFLEGGCYVGKNRGNTWISDEFKRAYEEAFPSVSENTGSRLYRRNSEKIIDRVSGLLKQVIQKNYPKTLIISNECLIDYANYDAERNRLVLRGIFCRLLDHLNGDISFRFLMTTRCQVDAITSHFAYDWPHIRNRFENLKDYVQDGILRHDSGVFGGYFFDSVWASLDRDLPATNVKFIPFERLKVDRDQYLKDIAGFFGLQEPSKSVLESCGRFVNSNTIGGVHRIRIPKSTRYTYYNKKIRSFVKSACGRVASGWISRIESQLTRDVARPKGGLKYRTGPPVDPISPEQERLLVQLYASSNRRYRDRLGINIDRLGYICDTSSLGAPV